MLLREIPPVAAPMEPSGFESCWHLYVIRTPERDRVQQTLESRGIGTMIHYPLPPYRQKAYAGLGLPKGSFPIADQLADEVLSLPMGPHLADRDWIHVLRETLQETLVPEELARRGQPQGVSRISPFNQIRCNPQHSRVSFEFFSGVHLALNQRYEAFIMPRTSIPCRPRISPV